MELNPSRVVGVIFLLLAVVSLLAADWLTAAIWAALGAGLVLLEGTLGSRRDRDGAASQRNRVAAAFLGAAVLMFVLQVSIQG